MNSNFCRGAYLGGAGRLSPGFVTIVSRAATSAEPAVLLTMRAHRIYIGTRCVVIDRTHDYFSGKGEMRSASCKRGGDCRFLNF